MTNHNEELFQKKWDRASIISVLQNFEGYCAETDKTGSIADYNQWRNERRDIPAAATIVKAFSSWNNAKKHILEEHPTSWINRTSRVKFWTEDDCLKAMREYEFYCNENNKSASQIGYLAFSKDKKLPSFATIVSHAPWNEMRKRAAGTNDLTLNNFPNKLYTVSSVLETIKRYKNDCEKEGHDPSVDGYRKWRKAQDDNSPSYETLYSLVGGLKKPIKQHGLFEMKKWSRQPP